MKSRIHYVRLSLRNVCPISSENQNPSPCGSQTQCRIRGEKILMWRFQCLMPTYRINGTESPLLTDPSTPICFWTSSQARDFRQKYGQPTYPIARFLGDQLPHRAYAKPFSYSYLLVFVLMCANNWIKSGEHQQPLVHSRWFARA